MLCSDARTTGDHHPPPRWSTTLLAVAASFALIALFAQVLPLIPGLGDYSGVLIAAMFLYLPAALVWRRGEQLSAIGLTFRLPCRGWAALGLVILIVFPLFSLGFFAFHAFFSPDSTPCVSAGRVLSWDDSLSPRDGPPGCQGLCLREYGNGLWLANRSVEPRSLTLAWEPAGTRAYLADDREDRPGTGNLRAFGRGPVRLAPGRGCLLAFPPEGPATLRVDGEGTLVDAQGAAHDLPFSTARGLTWLLNLLLVQLLLIALPEELFYRGWLQTSLSALIRRRWTILGADVGPAVWLTSAFFAAGHLLSIPSLVRLDVFFPSLLFGWLRNKTGSVVPGIILHALSNVLLTLLYRFLC